MGRQQRGERVGAVPMTGRRYLCRPVAADGLPRLGNRDTLIREYANDANAIRYMHRHLLNLPAGQYVLTYWPVTGEERHVAYLYRTVDR
jgi:hypothetical protein